jgi:GxxExxY protein
MSSIPTSELDRDLLAQSVISAAFEVHKELGPGLLESAYEMCLCHELALRSVRFRRQIPLPVTYKGIKLACGYRMDLLVDDAVIVEVKSTDGIWKVHEAQLLTYLRLSGMSRGVLINFNVPQLKDGIRRMGL